MKLLHPRRLLRNISVPLYNKLWALEFRLRRINALHKASKKTRLNVIFMVLEAKMWKLDSLYEGMVLDNRFNPILCVVPHNKKNHTEEYVNDSLNDVVKMFKTKHYRYTCLYDTIQNKYQSLIDLDPDIIIYLDPYEHKIEPRYHYSNYSKILTCYIDYSFCITNKAFNYDEPIQITAWKNYIATEYHKQLAKKYAYMNKNAVVVGYPVYDMFQSALMKKRKKNKKIIIWAPHQSIFPLKGDEHAAVRWSTFLLYSELMLNLAKKYVNDIHFIFRPHPMLKYNLYKHPNWGREKTDEYYLMWQIMPNTEVSDVDYVEQFCSSDAFIHDGGGFMIEYLYTQQPCLYLSNYIDEFIANDGFNEIGLAAWNAHYHARTEEEICRFVEDVVLKGNDDMASKRNEVLMKYAIPAGKSVANNIISDLKDSIYGKHHE